MADMPKPEYPQHEKLRVVADQSQMCGEFIEWLGTKGINLAEWDGETGRMYPTHQSTTPLLAEFFGIDLKALDAEKAAILKAFRERPGQ